MKKFLASALALTIMFTAFTGCGDKEEVKAPSPVPEEETPISVGVVFATGGLGDKSFNDSVYIGIVKAEKELGIEVEYAEPMEVSEFESYQRDFARSGAYDLVVGVGFDQVDAMRVVAEDFPEQKFVIIDAFLEMDNVSSVTCQDHEKGFLVGALVAGQTETGKIGIVGGMDVPLINAFASGYVAGAAYVDPSVDVSIEYVGSWADVSTAKMLATNLYDEGCDIVWAAAGGSGLGVYEAAKEKGLFCVGADVNQTHEAPDNMIASALRRLDNVMFSEIKALVDGEFTAGTKCVGLLEEAVDYTTEGSNLTCKESAIEGAEKARKEIIAGNIDVPSNLEDAQAYVDALK